MSDPDHQFEVLSTTDALRKLDVDRNQGLSSKDAKKRYRKIGRNELSETKRRQPLRILFDQFKSIVILLLATAAVVAFLTARWAEGIALVGVTLVNTLISFFSEWKAERSMAALRGQLKQDCRVRRDGISVNLDTTELVPGDLVFFETGELIPADLRVLEADRLLANEAALTGESVPVNKQTEALESGTPLAERSNLLFKGTSISEGSGLGVVIATGMETELGHISRMVEEAEGHTTPLQRKLDNLGRRLAWITIGIAMFVAGSGLAAGRDTLLMIETSIALGVAAIPEGLPIVATIALARGMYLMSLQNAIVNKLTAVETLGATGVIFTDKTGTLTENRMSVNNVLTARNEFVSGDESGKSILDSDDELLQAVARIGVLCNNASLRDDQEDSTGDPTEIALLEFGKQFEFDRASLLEQTPEKREVSFDPDVMKMATYHQDGEDRFYVAVKGSPEAVLNVCSYLANDEGQQKLSDEMRQEWRSRADRLASGGLRLLAVADKRVESIEMEPYSGLRFVGLVCLADPPRTDVREAVEECQRAGIRAVMVTGDRPDTGEAIGEKVGLATDGEAIHGSELSDLDQLTDEERNRVLNASVFARVTPEQKLNLIKVYQDQGEIVAMTGDGVNDAPALKQADIGVAMGKRGTDAAKQVAEMVLRDDRFSSIVSAVEQGRIIFVNIRKSVLFMLCTNLAEILVVTIASLVHLPIPLRPLQILYLNVLTDVFPALSLGIGKGDGDVMNQPPRDPKEPVLTTHHWKAIGAWSGVIGACVLAGLCWALFGFGFSETKTVTISFLTLGFSKLWFVLNLRGRGSTVWDNDVIKNRWIWASLALCSGLLLAAVYVPPLAGVLDTKPPGITGWMLLFGMSLVPAVLGIFVPGIQFQGRAKQQMN